MKLLNFFKKKQERKKTDITSAAEDKISKTATEVREIAPVPDLGFSEKAAKTLFRPHLAEKSAALSDRGGYIFRVALQATKQEIKKSIEELYKVKIEKINVIRIPQRQRGVGRYTGRRAAYKKAVVRLAPGQKIEFA